MALCDLLFKLYFPPCDSRLHLRGGMVGLRPSGFGPPYDGVKRQR